MGELKIQKRQEKKLAIKVFIDTSVYENANFSFANKQFSKLKELIEEESVE